jgi:anaphase-promoting complex subunit 1
LEGGDINVDVCSPGATIALALIYMKSNNADILHRMALPETIHSLDTTRPDLLMYRAMAKCVIMWENIDPTEEWIDTHIPQKVLEVVFVEKPDALDPAATKAAKIQDLFKSYNKSYKKSSTLSLDPKTALSLYLNVITGYCWGIGLVHAGTFSEIAKKTILNKLKFLQRYLNFHLFAVFFVLNPLF